jgi:hypothetical protein
MAGGGALQRRTGVALESIGSPDDERCEQDEGQGQPCVRTGRGSGGPRTVDGWHPASVQDDQHHERRNQQPPRQPRGRRSARSQPDKHGVPDTRHTAPGPERPRSQNHQERRGEVGGREMAMRQERRVERRQQEAQHRRHGSGRCPRPCPDEEQESDRQHGHRRPRPRDHAEGVVRLHHEPVRPVQLAFPRPRLRIPQRERGETGADDELGERRLGLVHAVVRGGERSVPGGDVDHLVLGQPVAPDRMRELKRGQGEDCGDGQKLEGTWHGKSAWHGTVFSRWDQGADVAHARPPSQRPWDNPRHRPQ